MSAKRRNQKVRKDDERRKERRRKAREILQALELWTFIRGTSAEEDFLSAHYPTPQIRLVDFAPADANAREIDRLSTKALQRCRFKAPLLGDQFSVADYITTVVPILELVPRIAFSDGHVQEAFEDRRGILRELADAETGARAALTVVRDIDDVLIKFGRIDERLYSVSASPHRNEVQKFTMNFTIHAHPIERRQVNKGGEHRPAFRCGQPFGLQGIEWLEWDGALIGGVAGRKCPVFVQNHVLDNLYRREKRALFMVDGEWAVHDYLWQSLRTPKIRPKRDDAGKYLVEYWLNAHKLGYLLVSLTDDVVLVETFLFLTMNGTPEGDLLWKELRLRKDDKKYLELDRIGTFLHTDIQHDAALRQLLDECGCGHLFVMLKEPPPVDRCLPGYAENMRKFLKMD
jgi:hypothetical protein